MVVAKCPLVLLEIKVAQPSPDVHVLPPHAGEAARIGSPVRTFLDPTKCVMRRHEPADRGIGSLVLPAQSSFRSGLPGPDQAARKRVSSSAAAASWPLAFRASARPYSA